MWNTDGCYKVHSSFDNKVYRFKIKNVTHEWGVDHYWGCLEGTTEEPPLPTMTQLFGNYPNPFNPTTSIRYSIEEPGLVSLDIYNVKGQLVKTLYHGNAEVGGHTVTWNGLDNSGNACSSGVYFYRLRTPNTSIIRKMLMLK